MATHRRPAAQRSVRVPASRPAPASRLAPASRPAPASRLAPASRPAPAGPVWMLRAALAGAVAVVAVVGLFVATGDLALHSGGRAAPVVASATADGSTAVHVVQPGDTLWSIAAAVAPGSDPRPIVDELARRSGGAGLQPGQRIALDGLQR